MSGSLVWEKEKHLAKMEDDAISKSWSTVLLEFSQDPNPSTMPHAWTDVLPVHKKLYLIDWPKTAKSRSKSNSIVNIIYNSITGRATCLAGNQLEFNSQHYI